MISRTGLLHEIKSIAIATAFFAACFTLHLCFKWLLLSEYRITPFGLSAALGGTLIVAKVVLIFEHIPLGPAVERSPAAVDVLLRTMLYTFGAFIVLLIERAIEARHEAGGILPGFGWVLAHRDIHHILATTIVVSSSLLVFNLWTALDERLGKGVVHRTLFAAPPVRTM